MSDAHDFTLIMEATHLILKNYIKSQYSVFMPTKSTKSTASTDHRYSDVALSKIMIVDKCSKIS